MRKRRVVIEVPGGRHFTYHTHKKLREGDHVRITAGVFRNRVGKVVGGRTKWRGYTYEVKKIPLVGGERAPCLWGSQQRVQVGSEVDRRRCHSLRARARSRDSAGRFLSYTEARYRRAETQEIEITLRNEGIANPRKWWDLARREIDRDRYSGYRRYRQNEWRRNALDHSRWREETVGATTFNDSYSANYPVYQANNNYVTFDTSTTAISFDTVTTANITATDNHVVEWGRALTTDGTYVPISTYAVTPNYGFHYRGPVTTTMQVSDALLRDLDLEATILPQLMARVQREWAERYGDEMPTDEAWVLWIQDRDQTTDNHQVGLAYGDERAVQGIWTQWSQQGVPTTLARGRPRVPTPEEHAEAERTRVAFEQARREAAQRAEEAKREREDADRRAEELLLAHLSEEQMQDWERANRFEVIVGERRYRIARGYAGNVYLLDEQGQPVERYCIHGDARMPEADHCLSQKLHLEADEAKFLQVANATRMRRRA